MARLAPDWLDNYYAYGIDNRRRRLFFHGDVNEENIANLMQGLVLLDDESNEPITIYMSSFGGSIYEMVGMYDLIVSCKCQVIGVGFGKIMSAAPLILRACDDALCYPSTQFMNHEESWGDDYKGHSHMKVDMKHFEHMEKLWAQLMGRHSQLSEKAWTAMCAPGRDRYATAEEALKWGLVDGIVQADGNVTRRPDKKKVDKKSSRK
jgi:ATP-dependent Clp protease protease subunit